MVEDKNTTAVDDNFSDNEGEIKSEVNAATKTHPPGILEPGMKAQPDNSSRGVLISAGTQFQLGVSSGQVTLAEDAYFTSKNIETDVKLAGMLAGHPENWKLNNKNFKYRHNPMNGALMPLADQFLSTEQIEGLTEDERMAFNLPSRPMPTEADRVSTAVRTGAAGPVVDTTGIVTGTDQPKPEVAESLKDNGRNLNGPDTAESLKDLNRESLIDLAHRRGIEGIPLHMTDAELRQLILSRRG